MLPNVTFECMNTVPSAAAERIQLMTATILATHPVGHWLHLIGGYRYRLLDASARASVDIDYHGEGDLQQKQMEIIVRYAHGLYGLPGAVSPQVLVPAIDAHAFITGHYASYGHNLVTQMPASITCFTDRRSPQAQRRITPLGRLDFVCVRSGVYFPAGDGAMASPAQALCDYVYLARRHGTAPESLLAFRNLAHICDAEFPGILARYPVSVRKHVERLLQGESYASAR